MEEAQHKRTATEWIGIAFVLISLVLLALEVLQSLDVIQDWLDDPLTGAVITAVIGALLVRLARNRKPTQSETT